MFLKRFGVALLFALTVFCTPVLAQYNAAWRNIEGQAITSTLQTGGTFQVWNATTIPASANDTVSGTLLADGTIPGANVTFNTTSSALTIGGLSDSAINATGVPNIVRVIDDSGARAQFTAKMAAATGTAQVVITDSIDTTATQLLLNRPFSGTITVQY